MATELQVEIAKNLKELKTQAAVVALGYNKGTVSKVAKKLKGGWKLEEELKAGGDGNQETPAPKVAVGTQTTNLKEASFIRIAPREFRMTSRIFWDAYEAVINTWEGWRDMSPSEFLDNYLELTLLQRGIFVGGYVVLNQGTKKEEDDGTIQNA